MRTLFRAPFLIAKRSKSFITTPIFYANGEPHIGHLYTAVLADAGHRWNLLKSRNLDPKKKHDGFMFTTGTDEHGIKIQTAAEKANVEPLKLCDRYSTRFHQLFTRFNVAHTDFIRTTEARHRDAVEAMWTSLNDKGLIYKDVYSGWYSVIDECFYSESDIESINVDGKEVKVAKATKNEVEFVGETNYMFKLSEFSEEIRKWLISTDVLRPKDYLPSVLQCIRKNEDLSISRDSKRLKWGIPVPGDPDQTIYVWLDALVNYLTVTGYPDMDKMQQSWPPTCQIIGKDILKFHAVYWPAMLMAIGAPLPKKLFVHAHWLVDGRKMSKSIGNVVDPFQASQALTVEGLKYFLLKQGVPHADGNFTVTKAVNMINADLVNNLGNLLNRAVVDKLNPKQRYPYFDVEVMERDLSNTGTVLINELNTLRTKCVEAYDQMMIYRALDAIMSVARDANAFCQLHAPWKLSQGPTLNTVLYITYETSRITSILLQPIVPEYANRVLDRLGVAENARGLDKAVFGGGPDYGSDLGKDDGPVLTRVKLENESNKMEAEGETFFDSMGVLPIGVLVFLGLFLLRRFIKGGQFTERVSAKGKVAVVTGANSGIGFQLCRLLNLKGAKVYMLCRNEERGNVAKRELAKLGCDATRLVVSKCDLNDFSTIHEFAEKFDEECLDILINNAGIMFCPKFELTVDGHEKTWQSNYLGHFLLTELLLPKLRSAPNGRIINQSSELHLQGHLTTPEEADEKKNFGPFGPYNRSKLAQVMHARELTRRLRQEGVSNVTVNATHPGVVATELLRSTLVDKTPIRQLWAPFRWFFFKTDKDGAQTAFFLALSKKVANISGQYFADLKEKKSNRLVDDSELCAKLYDYGVKVCLQK